MSSTKILQRLRYVLSFCEDMPSKGRFHNLNRKFFRGYVMSSPFVKTCLQRINAMSSTKILQRLRYVLSFCEDMSSKGKFHNLNRKFFRGYVMSSPFVKTCLQRINAMSSTKILQRLRYVLSLCEDMSSKAKLHNLNRKFFRGYVMSSPFVKTCLQRINAMSSTKILQRLRLCPLLLWRHVFTKAKFHNLNRAFFRGYVMSSSFVKTCLQRINAMSSTKILQRLRHVLSFCEDMSSKGKFHNLNRKFFRGYVMSSPFVKTCPQRINALILTRKFFRGYVMSSPFVKTCLQRINAMSSTKILQRLRYVLSFCEDMSSKAKFHNLNRKFFRGYVMSSPFVKTCLQRINAMSSTKILQRLRNVLSFVKTCPQRVNSIISTEHSSEVTLCPLLCEDMSSKAKFHELNRKFFRGYVMSSPFVKTCLQRVNSIILTRNSSKVTLCPLLLWRHVFKG